MLSTAPARIASGAAIPAPEHAHHRVKVIDGRRAVAAAFVVLAHAVTYRFADQQGAAMHYLKQVCGPLAEIGVQLFMRLGRRWSSAIYDRSTALHGRQAESA